MDVADMNLCEVNMMGTRLVACVLSMIFELPNTWSDCSHVLQFSFQLAFLETPNTRNLPEAIFQSDFLLNSSFPVIPPFKAFFRLERELWSPEWNGPRMENRSNDLHSFKPPFHR